MRPIVKLCGMLSATAALAGCATYHALPLPEHTNLATSASASAAATASVPVKLNLRQAGVLAQARDPALAASREQARVAQAQAYDAGLLPDPSLPLFLGHPFNGGANTDHHNTWSVGLTESLIGLITHGDVHAAASAHYAEAMLSWRWQAEQVALKAQVTYIDAWAAGREVRALRMEAAAAQSVLKAAQRSHEAGALAPVLYQQALTLAAAVRSRLQSAADNEIQAQTTLATMLRVEAGRQLCLDAPAPMSAPATATVNAALEKLPERRLDLLALQAGYRSANAKLRADILAQFPILDIGFTRGRDNTGVNSVGIGITLRLPIFNGNRGKIAIDRATRKALNAAYQARLDEAANGVRAVFARFLLARSESAVVNAQLRALARTAHATQAALARGEATRFQAFAALSAWLDARIDADRLRATTAQLALTLRTLLALPPSSAGIST